MREIKFRIWAKNENKMVYPNKYVIDLNWFGVTSETYLDDSSASEYPIESKNYNLMQYTGLKDKNGVEIYEGDILTVGENLICEIIYIGENIEEYGDEIHCSFHAKIFKHNKIIPIDSYLKNNCIIIRNIYENPELLNSQNNG